MKPEALLDNPLTLVDLELAAVIFVLVALVVAYAKMSGSFTAARAGPASGIGAFVGGWLVNHDRISTATGVPPGLWMWAAPVVFAGIAAYSTAERRKALPAALIAGVCWGAAVRFAGFGLAMLARPRG